MANSSEMSRLMTKLSLTRIKMQKAKASGNIQEAQVWLENMAQLKREIASYSTQNPTS